jgi:hypothetical protein
MLATMSLPVIRHCLICEDIRIEQRNLVSFMGIYGFTPYVEISIVDFKLPVAFCAVFNGEPVNGKLAITLQVQAIDGTRLQAQFMPEINEQIFQPQVASAFAFRVNVVFPKPDTYNLVALANEKEFFKDSVRVTQLLS